MRLLSVIHGPVFGGAHNQALELDGPLSQRGVETTVVLPVEATAARERLSAAGVETVQLPLHRLRATPRPGVQAGFLAAIGPEIARLRRLIRERRVDVVQAHGPTNPHAAVAAHLEQEVALVWQLLDTRAPMLVRRVTMPVVVRLADAITVWGRELARVHPGTSRVGERLVTVFPPVDAEKLAPNPATRASSRADLRIPEGAPAIGTVAVLNPQKGHEYLIRAAAIIAGTRADIAVRILGASSPAHSRYERRLRAEARTLGLEDRGRLDFVDPGLRARDLIQALDVFVLASPPRSEGMPTAILEAMACGKPVVATDVGAVRELVEDGVTGLVVEPGSARAMADAIQRLLADEGLSGAMGAEGRRRAVEGFGLDRLADLHLRAYELARAHRRRRSQR